MRYKNVFGDWEYELGKFFVNRHSSTGKWHILKREPWYVTDATVMPLWDKPPVFDSFVQAVKWLKENVDSLI